MLIQALFYLFATILVLAALGVITSRNPVYSALALVLCFVTAAAIWLLLEAEFLAVVLVLVYVGAVMVLFLFVVVMFEIVGVIWAHGKLGIDASHGGTPTPAGYSNTLELGRLLYTRYAYPLELAAMLLLVAIIAALALTLRHRAGYKQQNISAQVAVRRADRLRVVKMDPEPRA